MPQIRQIMSEKNSLQCCTETFVEFLRNIEIGQNILPSKGKGGKEHSFFMPGLRKGERGGGVASRPFYYSPEAEEAPSLSWENGRRWCQTDRWVSHRSPVLPATPRLRNIECKTSPRQSPSLRIHSLGKRTFKSHT